MFQKWSTIAVPPFVAALPMPIAILARVAGVRLLFIAVHESVHAVAAIVLGYRRITVRIFCRQPYTKVSNIGSHDHGLVRHAGWIASLVIAALLTRQWLQEAAWCCWWLRDQQSCRDNSEVATVLEQHSWAPVGFVDYLLVDMHAVSPVAVEDIELGRRVSPNDSRQECGSPWPLTRELFS